MPPPVAIVMGSQSDWATMRHAADVLDELGVALCGPHRLGASHARAPVRLRQGCPRGRHQGDRRRCRRCGPPAGHDRRADHLAGAGRAGRERGAQGLGQPVLDRPDAGRRAGRHAGDRPRRGQSTRPCWRPRSWPWPILRSTRRCSPGGRTRPTASRKRRRKARKTTHDPDSARRHHRHPGRRPARPHGGHGGSPTGLSLPRAGAGAESPAGEVAAAYTRADYDDEAALAAFAAAVDVVTFEFENVPVATAEALARHKPVRPSADVLRVTQDRLAEKDFVRSLDIPVTAYARVTGCGRHRARRTSAWATACSRRCGWAMTARVSCGWMRPPSPTAAWSHLGQPVLIYEAWVDFALELSVVTARNPQGAQASYVPVENRHRHHILDVTVAPAPIPDEIGGRSRGHGRADRPRAAAGGAAGGRDVPDPRWSAAGQRAGAAAAQFGPLDHRCLRGEPVRAAGTRGLRAATGRSGAHSRMRPCTT